MFHIVLVEPEIPPNTGNIARLCAAVGCVLHLVGPLGFRLTDSRLRRAGLDYWEYVLVERHSCLLDLIQGVPEQNLFFYSKCGSRSYTKATYREGAYLVFGNETRGLPKELLQLYAHRVWTIPMFQPGVRSLNLSNAVAIVCYEALRQVGRV